MTLGSKYECSGDISCRSCRLDGSEDFFKCEKLPSWCSMKSPERNKNDENNEDEQSDPGSSQLSTTPSTPPTRRCDCEALNTATAVLGTVLSLVLLVTIVLVFLWQIRLRNSRELPTVEDEGVALGPRTTMTPLAEPPSAPRSRLEYSYAYDHHYYSEIGNAESGESNSRNREDGPGNYKSPRRKAATAACNEHDSTASKKNGESGTGTKDTRVVVGVDRLATGSSPSYPKRGGHLYFQVMPTRESPPQIDQSYDKVARRKRTDGRDRDTVDPFLYDHLQFSKSQRSRRLTL
ncbi:uncharacterized protein LOC110986766 isoform X2 [Acanthaster planci]|uniref:Uncharacterized protein LOC110986766 isoform X2 n=1 Tax=Acanthaster planci TaxID=133434 RepID=A0A8B7ZI07_ACAPL|nr:uncharacterized protein LOC110986766 isoform X2 [Acanthaster planci]